MKHKKEEEEKKIEFGNLFMSLDESGQDEALHILRTLTVNQADTFASDLKQQSERQTVQ